MLSISSTISAEGDIYSIQKVGVNPYLEFTGRSVSLSDTISFSLPIISIYHNNGKKNMEVKRMKLTIFVQISYLTVNQSPRPPNAWFNVVYFARC